MTGNTDQHTEHLESLLPHRAPMLLLDQVATVSAQYASALVSIHENSLFFIPGAGVPAWTGLEMMGQTAALMAGFQQQQGLLEAQNGFLLGCRRFDTSVPWFTAGQRLHIDCHEDAVVGNNLATFRCTISEQADAGQAGKPFASALLSVYRQPVASTGASATDSTA